MKWITMILVGAALTGCSAQGQQTPEPTETERINQLVEQLGTQRSYNSKTLLMNPDPDGIVLSRWLRRRQATLDGSLTLSQLPATSNPGSIADTLVWEREAEQKERAPGNDKLGVYMVSSAMRGELTCPQNYRVEHDWLDKYTEEHRKGLHNTLIDWNDANAYYQRQCDAEKGSPQPQTDEPEPSEQACFDMQNEPGEDALAFQARKNECLQPFIE